MILASIATLTKIKQPQFSPISDSRILLGPINLALMYRFLFLTSVYNSRDEDNIPQSELFLHMGTKLHISVV